MCHTDDARDLRADEECSLDLVFEIGKRRLPSASVPVVEFFWQADRLRERPLVMDIVARWTWRRGAGAACRGVTTGTSGTADSQLACVDDVRPLSRCRSAAMRARQA
jgi:hypothetical protein